MTYEWITDRLPTKADADEGFLVKVPYMPGDVPPANYYQHYSLIVPGQPWWSYVAAERVEVERPPAPTRKVDQFVTAGDDLFARCDDGTMWTLGHRDWTQLPAIPQPEA